MTTQPQLEINERGAIYVPEYITIQGKINRIIFHNPENGYTVLSLAVELEGGAKDGPENSFNEIPLPDLKLTGHLAAPREGDEYRFTGPGSIIPALAGS